MSEATGSSTKSIVSNSGSLAALMQISSLMAYHIIRFHSDDDQTTRAAMQQGYKYAFPPLNWQDLIMAQRKIRASPHTEKLPDACNQARPNQNMR